jgi:tetratricopeptide (TPR) repeat protein
MAQFEKSEKLLKQGFKLFPKNVEMYRQFAMLKTDQASMLKPDDARVKRHEARVKIEEGLKQQPREPNLLWMLAEVQLQDGDLKGAQATVDEMSTIPTVAKTMLDLVKAEIRFANKEWLPASREFERLRKEFNRMPEQSLHALMLSAQCYQQLGEFDKQLEACRAILDVNPQDWTARLGVASALLSTGKMEEAKKEYEQLYQDIRAKKETQVVVQSPHLWLPLFQFRLADAMKAPPKERMDMLKQLEDGLVRSLQKSGTAKPESIALVLSEIQYHEGELDKAYKTLKDAAEKSPSEAALWSGMATIMLEKGKDKGIDLALKELDAAPKSVRGDVALRLNRAGLIARRGGENVKAALAELEIGIDELSPVDRSRLRAGLGAVLYSLQENEGAVRYWKQVAKDNPDDIKIRLSLIEVGRLLGKDDVMSQMVDDMRRIMGPDSDEALYAEATRSFAQARASAAYRATPGSTDTALDPEVKGQLEKAIKTLGKVSRARPDWYQVAHVLADAELLYGNVDAAIEHYKQALKVGPADRNIVRPVVMLLMKAGRMKEADSIIELVGRDKIKDMQLGSFIVESDAAKGAHTDALKEAIQEVPEDAKGSNATYGHLWVGRLYAKAGDMKNAEKRFRLAVKTGPESPETWLTLVEHLVTNNKREEAASALMQARKELPEDRVNLVLGPGYEVVGEDVLAEQYYRAAIDANPKEMAPHKLLALFLIRKNRTEQARKEVLTVLQDAQGKPAAKGDLLWARRTLAEILAGTGDNEDFRRAKSLLVANVKLNDIDAEDQLKLANLLATRLDEPASLREAQKYFESIKTLGVREKMTLANIHDVLGNWSQARGEMLDLIGQQAQSPDAALYSAYVEMLLRHGNVPEAANYLDKLKALQNGFESPLRARVLMKQGNPAAAAKLLETMLPKQRPVPKEQVWRLQATAIEMDRLGLDAKTEDLYREYMSYVPGNGALQLASFLGRKGHIDDALDLCEKALKTEPPRSVLQATSEVLHGQPKSVKPQHIERVSKWYEQLLADHPGSVPLMMQQADFLILAGQDAKAEQLFRDLLGHSDLNATERAIAQNDLAFVLATQHKSLDEALRLVNEAGEMMGFRSDLLDTRGMVYLAMGRYADAANDFQEAVTVINPSAVKYLHLGYSRLLAKDRDGARAGLHSAKDAQLDSATLNRAEQDMYEQLNKDVGP